jgi:hypothetical protein
VACGKHWGENINVYRILVRKTERYCLATQGTKERIILKQTLKKQDGTVLTGFIWQGNRDPWQAFVKTV